MEKLTVERNTDSQSKGSQWFNDIDNDAIT